MFTPLMKDQLVALLCRLAGYLHSTATSHRLTRSGPLRLATVRAAPANGSVVITANGIVTQEADATNSFLARRR